MPPTKKEKQIIIQEALTYIADKPDLLQLISSANTVANQTQLVRHIQLNIPSVIHIPELFSTMVSYVGNNPQQHGPLLSVHKAIKSYQEEKGRLDKLKKDFSYDMCFSNNPAVRQNFLNTIQSYNVTLLDKPYPPPKQWIYESQAIHDLWHTKLQVEKQPDDRLARLPMHLLDPNQLQLDISEEKSMIFHDAKTGEIIGLVIRNWMPQTWRQTVGWVDGIVVDGCEKKKSIRLEDPGKITQIGFSGGLRSKPTFDWARNLLSKKYAPDTISTLDYSCSSIFALLWNMCCHRLPLPIIDDFNAFLKTTNIARMQNTSSHGGVKYGDYTVQVNSEDIKYRAVELAPPVGFFGMNYARGTHNESCPHKYAIFWTTCRTLEKDDGGHFFIADYGIRIRGATNTLVVWQPKNWHGTTLSAKGPNDHNMAYRQSGLSIVTPNRLIKVWEKYMQSQLTAMEIEEEMMVSGSELDSDTEME